MFKTAGAVLRRGSSLSGKQTINALRVRQVADEVVKDHFKDYGDEVLKKIKVAVYRRGVLIIEAPNILNVEIITEKNGLIKKINSKIGNRLLVDIKTRIARGF